MKNYYIQLRQDFIADCLSIFGFVNRTHLSRKFGISPQQASADLKRYKESHPGELRYKIDLKTYVAPDFEGRQMLLVDRVNLNDIPDDEVSKIHEDVEF